MSSSTNLNSTSDFFQLRLDNQTTTIGQEELTKSRERIKELEIQLEFYEKSELEHKKLETNMRNSFSSFSRDIDDIKKQLSISEIRNQELAEDNVKMQAQLNGRIDLLMNEREQYTNFMEQEHWCTMPRHQAQIIAHYLKSYHRFSIKIDLDTHETTCVMPIEPIKVNANPA